MSLNFHSDDGRPPAKFCNPPPVFASSTRPSFETVLSSGRARAMRDLLAPHIAEEAIHTDRARRALSLSGVLTAVVARRIKAGASAPSLSEMGDLISFPGLLALRDDALLGDDIRFEIESWLRLISGYRDDRGVGQAHCVLDQHHHPYALVRNALLTSAAGISATGPCPHFAREACPEPQRKVKRLLNSKADVMTCAIDKFFPQRSRHADSLALLAMLMRWLVVQRANGLDLTIDAIKDALELEEIAAIPDDKTAPARVSEWFRAWLDDPFWMPHDGPCRGRQRLDSHQGRVSIILESIDRMERAMAYRGVA